jgi:hypothetical protein
MATPSNKMHAARMNARGIVTNLLDLPLRSDGAFRNDERV